jgi:hypothetical protein
MIHHRTSLHPQSDHYAVSVSGSAPYVLAQLQADMLNNGIPDQVRTMLTPAEARHMAQLLVEAAASVEARVGEGR